MGYEQEWKGWGALPLELVQQILEELGDNELLAMMRVCQALLSPAAALLYSRYHIVGSRLQACMRGLRCSSQSLVKSVCGLEWKLGMVRRIKAITILHDSLPIDMESKIPLPVSPLDDRVLFPELQTLAIDFTRCTHTPLGTCCHTCGALSQGWKNAQDILRLCRPRHLCVKGGYGHASPGEFHPLTVTIHEGLNVSYGLPWLCIGETNTFALPEPKPDFTPMEMESYNKDHLSHNIASWMKYYQETFLRSWVGGTSRWQIAQLSRVLLEEEIRKCKYELEPDVFEEACAEIDGNLGRKLHQKVVELYPEAEGRLDILSLAETAALRCPACGDGVTC